MSVVYYVMTNVLTYVMPLITISKSFTNTIMKSVKKSEYLQLRVSKEQKKFIKSSAQVAGLDMSAWILKKIIDSGSKKFIGITEKFSRGNQSFIFAELHDFLIGLSKDEFILSLPSPGLGSLTELQQNYIVAMIVHRAHQLNAPIPDWLKKVPILKKPHFGTDLKSLKLHLLINSPVAFKQRNIFIDSSIGERV